MKATLTVILLSFVACVAQGEVIRVWSEAAPGGDGSSWPTALQDLQAALSQATSGDEIWVARGVYKPAADAGRTNSFALKTGVAIYGGFTGTETERDQRDADPRTNGTVLSGDIDGNDINTDGNSIAEDASDVIGLNSYHVVTALDISGVTLDGLTVTAGQADGAAEDSQGGGIRVERVSDVVFDQVLLTGNTAVLGGGYYSYLVDFVLTRSTLHGNHATSQGGGLHLVSSDGEAAQVTLEGNSAGAEGGGMFVDEGDLLFIQLIVVGNHSDLSGGGIFVSDGHPILSQSVLAGNSAGAMGGGIAGDTVTVHNSIMWQNTPLDPFGTLFLRAEHCLIEGGVLGGENIITNAPLFARDPDPANHDFGDLRLLVGSPALDAGSNALLPADVTDLDDDGLFEEPLPVDFSGRDRVLNSTVDLGPFEGGFATFSHLYPELDREGDANSNGYSNVGEYAFITDPTAPGDLPNRPRIRRTNDMLFLEYTRRANAVDLQFSVSRSADLLNWVVAVEGGDYEIVSAVLSGDNADALQTVLRIQEEPPRHFYRIDMQ